MSSIARIDYMLRLSAVVVTIAFAGLQIHANDFGLIDQEGRFHQLSRYSDKQAIVLFVQKKRGCDIKTTSSHDRRPPGTF